MSEEAAWQRENDDLRAVVVKQALRIHGLERQVDMNEVVAAEDDRAADSAEQGMQEALARAVKAEAAVADLARRGEQDVQAVRDEYDGYREGVAEQVRTLARFCKLPEDATLQQCYDLLRGYPSFAGGEPFETIHDIKRRHAAVLGELAGVRETMAAAIAETEVERRRIDAARAELNAGRLCAGIEALGPAR